MDCSMQASLSLTISWSLLKFMSLESGCVCVWVHPSARTLVYVAGLTSRYVCTVCLHRVWGETEGRVLTKPL